MGVSTIKQGGKAISLRLLYLFQCILLSADLSIFLHLLHYSCCGCVWSDKRKGRKGGREEYQWRNARCLFIS